MVQLIERDAGTRGSLVHAYGDVPAGLQVELIRALGRSGTEEDLMALADLLGQSAETELLVLIEIGRVGAAVAHPIDEAIRESVRPYLSEADAQMRIEAAATVEKLEDYGAIGDLIRWTESDGRLVARARTALRALVGKDRGSRAAAWSRWYEAELDWWQRTSQSDFDAIRMGGPARASRVLMELADRRIFRYELVDPVAEALKRSEPEIVVVACSVLGHLGARQAAPKLVEKLSSPDESVRLAAVRALQRITGLKLSSNPQAWKGAKLE